jgi:FkbM family methyltransferase
MESDSITGASGLLVKHQQDWRWGMIKQWSKAIVNSLGFDVVRYPRSPLGRHLRNFIGNNAINLVIDAGACDGGFCRLLRTEANYFGPIVSFEPCGSTFSIAQQKMMSDPNWRGFQLGLSDSDTEGALHTYGENADFNSLLVLRDRDAEAFDVNLAKKGLEKVELRRLDGLWDQVTKGITSPRVFLKSDTQGYDRQVILGAVGHLDAIVGIQSEIPAIEIYEGMTSMIDMLTFYRDLSFVPVGFYEVNRPDGYDGIAPEFDVIFKRNSLTAGEAAARS